MHIRDAVEDDAEAIAALADAPADVVRNLVHDRSVRVAERQQGNRDPNVDTNAYEADLLGFVSFDAHDRTVHVTQFGGTTGACERLLAEPVRFAAAENMAVEVLVETDAIDKVDAVEAAGFEAVGTGPMFRGSRTVRYRMHP
ncbi:MAG: hypothetical protein ACOC0Z_05465 [Halohasta sp.]